VPPIGGEVFCCEDVDRLIQRGEMFFACMPQV
jgi:hypothetical protein